MMTFHPTLWKKAIDWRMKGDKSRCGKGKKQSHCIGKSPIGLIGG